MEPAPPLPLLARVNWYWICQLGGWTLLGLANIAVNYKMLDRPGLLAVCVWSSLCGMAVSQLWRRVLRRHGGTAPRWRRIAPLLLPLAALQSGLVALAFAVLQPFGPVTGLAWVPGALVFWTGTFMVWTLLYSAVQSVRRASQLEAQALRLQVAAKDAELRALQAQVNPHFFFNSMNSVRALLYEDRDAAASMIDRLAGLMRYALQSGQLQTVPLAQELEVVENYLAIEKIRFEERLRSSMRIAPGMDQVRVPPMALQTLVENAVKYGVELSAAGSDIAISAWREAGLVRIEIANTGAIRGCAGSNASTASTGLGLANARKRLALAVGREASLDLDERGGWVRATLTFPEAA